MGAPTNISGEAKKQMKENLSKAKTGIKLGPQNPEWIQKRIKSRMVSGCA
jgi:hypothetical protein